MSVFSDYLQYFIPSSNQPPSNLDGKATLRFPGTGKRMDGWMMPVSTGRRMAHCMWLSLSSTPSAVFVGGLR